MSKIIISFATLALLGALFVFSFSSSKKPDLEPLKIATFNVRFDNKADNENAWENRKELAKDLIFFYDFDIFGTQEALFNQLKYLDEQLEKYDSVALGRDGLQEGETCAIFYKCDRFDLLAKGTFWYSETPDIISYGWDATKHRRICTYARLYDKLLKKNICVFNSHFDHIAAEAKKQSAKLLLEKIEKIAGQDTIFCLGDFNSFPDSEPMKIIFSSPKLKDSKSISKKTPYGANSTYHAFKGFEPSQKDRIDYIFVSSNVDVLSYKTISDSFQNRFPSDHFPVMVEAVIKE